MGSPYRWFGCAACLLLIATAPAQLFVRPGFNDPTTLVDQMMSDMPRSLGLTTGQRKAMRRIYLDLSRQEQKIYFQPGSSFVKRGQVRRLDEQAERKIQGVLRHRQYVELQHWMHQEHHPKRLKHPRSLGSLGR